MSWCRLRKISHARRHRHSTASVTEPRAHTATARRRHCALCAQRSALDGVLCRCDAPPFSTGGPATRGLTAVPPPVQSGTSPRPTPPRATTTRAILVHQTCSSAHRPLALAQLITPHCRRSPLDGRHGDRYWLHRDNDEQRTEPSVGRRRDAECMRSPLGSNRGVPLVECERTEWRTSSRHRPSCN